VRGRAIIVAAAAFILGLLYLTLSTTVREPGAAASERAELEGACAAALRGRLPGARLPFPARASALDDGRYRVEGVVDAPAGPEMLRRNYACVVRRGAAGAVRVDSLGLWQSH
jgi:hypothetical protein